MALSHTERFGERKRGNGSATRVYTIIGDSDEDETDVFTYLLNNADAISGLVITDASCNEIANAGTNVYYRGEVQYGLQSLPQPQQAVNEVRVSARGSLTTANLKYSRSTIGSHPASWFKGDGAAAGTSADFGGQVGIKDDGEVAGLDVQLPSNVLSVSNVLPDSTVTAAYQYAAEQLVGSTNSLAYRSRAAGTLLCSAITFQQVDTENYNVTAEFLFEPNATGLTIGGITGIDKKGHEYIWAYNVPRKVDGRVVPSIAQINVEQVYPSADFATTLGF